MGEFQHSSLDEWKLRMEQKTTPSALLCGAKRWDGSHDKEHRLHCSKAHWTTTDIAAGDEVDIVADLQSMWQTCEKRFDGIFCPAVLEHIERPWVAMYSMSHLLNSGGVLFIQTHQTFPLHGYPDDYYRFSTLALRSLCFDAGLTVETAEYDGPCTINPIGEYLWNPLAKSFLNVSLCATKP